MIKLMHIVLEMSSSIPSSISYQVLYHFSINQSSVKMIELIVVSNWTKGQYPFGLKGQGVEIDVHIWGLVVNQYVHFSFHGNHAINFPEIQQIKYLTLKIQDQGHNKNQPKSDQVINRSQLSILPKIKKIWKVDQNLSCESKSAAAASSARTNIKTWSHFQ